MPTVTGKCKPPGGLAPLGAVPVVARKAAAEKHLAAPGNSRLGHLKAEIALQR